jgi:hypothetical protein
MWAQRKILVVFNCGQKNGSISGRHLVKPASGQKNGLLYGHYRHKAGRAALWLSCAACFELSASVYAGKGASQAVHLPADGVSYKTVHHLLGHFYDGRLPKQFKSSIK